MDPFSSYEAQEDNRIRRLGDMQVKDLENKWNKITCTLAKYAEYANIRGDKTGGFGVTKPAIRS